jgi:hypothetical protein
MFKHNHTATESRRHPVRRLLAAAFATSATLTCGLAATAGVAHADTIDGYTVDWATGAGPIEIPYDELVVAVPNASTTPGTRIIQWEQDYGSEQNWYLDQVYNPNGTYIGDFLRNQNSNLCIQTDGNPGDTVYQEPCNPANGLMVWMPNYIQTGWVTYVSYTNEATGLNLDVYGDSYNEGDNLDAWYPNGGDNQEFLAG